MLLEHGFGGQSPDIQRQATESVTLHAACRRGGGAGGLHLRRLERGMNTLPCGRRFDCSPPVPRGDLGRTADLDAVDAEESFRRRPRNLDHVARSMKRAVLPRL